MAGVRATRISTQKNKVSKRLEAKLSSKKEKCTECCAAQVFTPLGVENFLGKDIPRKAIKHRER